MAKESHLQVCNVIGAGMKVLFTGTGQSGTWVMRGEQMASTRKDWKAVPNATRQDVEAMDVVVVVKRIKDDSLREMHAWNGPLVYDALDFWGSQVPQIHSLRDVKQFVHPVFERIAPNLILCPTQEMARDLKFLGWSTSLLYHHYDPRLQLNINEREGRKRVVYHGRRANMGWWSKAAAISCFLHRAEFVVSNGPTPPSGDVLIAVRKAKSWFDRRWKSNVKAAIALKLGTPFVAWPEAAYRETHPDAFWFSNVFEMHRAIGEALTSDKTQSYEDFSLSACANKLERILTGLLDRSFQSTVKATVS